MHRDLARLSRETFDLLIVGGGITGASIARDAALRGLSVALVEKNDFAHATSAHNSKLIHGGLRYLRNFELRLVRESLAERRIWQRTAPHLVSPLPFLIPHGSKGRATLSAGLALYDLLSFDRGWLADPAQRLPGHSWLDRQNALEREPRLDMPDLAGAFLYYDAQMYSPERLALSSVIDAVEHGAIAANHLEAQNLLIRSGKVEGATVRDAFSESRFDVRARLTILAAGPWADVFLSSALGASSSHRLVRSKGIHLIVPALTAGHALTMATQHGHFFVLPWRGYSILGTTDTPFGESPDAVGTSESDIEAFLRFVNTHLPSARLKRGDVKHFYAGLRPLVDDGGHDTYAASRRAEVIDHSRDDHIDGLFSVIGGKWTTSRALAESTLDRAVSKIGIHARPCSTRWRALPGGDIERIAPFLAQVPIANGNPAHLGRLYGTRVRDVLALIHVNPDFARPLGENGDIAAQIMHAMREEMALTLEDAIMRRTGVGQLGRPAANALDFAAFLMATELGWSEERKRAEIAAVEHIFQTVEAGP